MRRDRLSVDLAAVGWLDTGRRPDQPGLVITFDGPERAIRDRFRRSERSAYDADELDVACRLHPSDRPTAAGGVLGVSDRLSGGYLLEADVAVDLIEEFVYAVRRYGTAGEGDARYTLGVRSRERDVATFETGTFLVYDPDGTLLRHRSLIPDGIEI